MQRLVSLVNSAYIGSKLNHDDVPLDESFIVLLEQFAGSGGSLMRYLQRSSYADKVKHIVVADADPCIRALWQAWADDALRAAMVALIEEMQREAIAPLAVAFQSYFKADWLPLKSIEWLLLQAKLLKYCKNFTKEKHNQGRIQTPDLLWQWWKVWRSQYDSIISNESAYNTEFKAAFGVVFRWLAQSSIVRTSGSGANNSALGWQERLEKTCNKVYQSPYLPTGCKVAVFDDWATATAYAATLRGRKLAISDPPYWQPSDGIKLNPSYHYHAPHSDSEFWMAVNSVTQARRVCDRVVAYNYRSPALEQAFADSWAVEDLGILARIGCGTGLEGGSNHQGQGNEYCWSWQKPRQLSLLEVAA
ncbi:hypothetical protein H6F86_21110 [Phormidium sp. FACHB-592]|uniref:Uncharacterized protein n=1 Tax=Stenomitos frigidus AS-A4 TaxID=2933935 RepID=A0ABV0KER6_9CYAN|nr:hypothetical protein [Phormidium sp. FACHB-592]MBD2076335.1 hypothetical protein [Phormidium sp. FACHB-592]